MTSPGFSRSILYPVFLLSGAAGLGYQIVWSKMFGLGLGHEMPAVLAVVTAFLGGMALGAWALDGVVSRSPHPARWYGGLAMAIGAWGWLTVILIPPANELALNTIGVTPSPWAQWSISFIVPLLILLPASAALGATLPAMERAVSPLAVDGRCVGALYAVNTLGAVIGILLTTFLFMPAWGFPATLALLGSLNVAGGGAVLWLARQTASVHRTDMKPVADPISTRRLVTTVGMTGLLGIGYEVLGVRVLSQVLENTVYTFAAVLSIYLLGTSIGAALYQRWGRQCPFRRLLTDLLIGLAAVCMAGIWIMSRSQSIYSASRDLFGSGQTGMIGAEMTVAAAVFALPTLFMGALFSHLVQGARRPEGGVGRAAAINTLGGALASGCFGVMLLSTIGTKWSLVIVALGYLVLVPRIQGWRAVAPAVPVLFIPLLPADLQRIAIPPDARVVEYREGVMASVAVVKYPDGNRSLFVNGKFQMGGTGAVSAERRHAHLPLLLHPAPKRALFLGTGTGVTFGAAGVYPDLTAHGVELVPEVIEVMDRFQPENQSPQQNPRLTMFQADARRFVRSTPNLYDVIVADLFHPARDGAGSLYTREHFQAIRSRLSKGGLFCQWLPLHQLSNDTLKLITRTFLDVFPQTYAYLLRFNIDTPVLGLIGYLHPPTYTSDWVESRMTSPKITEQLRELRLTDAIRMLGCLVADPVSLKRFAGAGPLNTDAHPRVTFVAPGFAYQQEVVPYDRLFDLLHSTEVRVQPNLLEAGSNSIAFERRIKDFIHARNVYLEGLVKQDKGELSEAIDSYVRSARLSRDFTLGYARCLSYATALARENPEAARALLRRLAEAQPDRPVADQLLKRLFKN